MQSFDNETLVLAFGFQVVLRKMAQGKVLNEILTALIPYKGTWICYDPDAESIGDWAIVGTYPYVIDKTAETIRMNYTPDEICAVLREYKNNQKKIRA